MSHRRRLALPLRGGFGNYSQEGSDSECVKASITTEWNGSKFLQRLIQSSQLTRCQFNLILVSFSFYKQVKGQAKASKYSYNLVSVTLESPHGFECCRWMSRIFNSRKIWKRVISNATVGLGDLNKDNPEAPKTLPHLNSVHNLWIEPTKTRRGNSELR